MSWDYKFGIEEEYFVNDAAKRDIAKGKISDFFEACRDQLSGDIQPEMLEPQIEIATKPQVECAVARAELAGLRATVGEIARNHNLSIMASGTHPVAVWTRVRANAQPRYGKVMHDLQMIGSRTVLCGMHVHVEVPDLGARIDIMNRIQPYLPLMLALSTSSPFWQSQRTGLLGYRLAAFRELPRTGLPDLFQDEADYRRYIQTLVEARAIENSSYVWWLIRPSLKHPTLELRVADSCTRVDDTIAIAALYRCLVRHLNLNPSLNAGQTGASRAINDENVWRAQRYGIHGSLVDEKTRSAKPVRLFLDEILDMIADDAKALGCERELDLTRWIVARGTSADQQLTLYTEALGRGLSNRDALSGVVDWLSAETVGETVIRH